MDPLNTPKINTQTPPQMMPPHDRKIGPVVGAVIILILLVLAALYFWSIKLNSKNETTSPMTSEIPMEGAKMNDGATVNNDVTATPAPSTEEVKIDKDLGLDGLNDIGTKTDF